MKLKWIKRSAENQSKKKLIIFFSGWGLDERVLDHLNDDEYDVVFLNDYRNLSFYFTLDEAIIFERYRERILVAWSFGVAAASTWVADSFAFQFDKKIAINGSMNPVDRYLGIPSVVMQKTIDTLSQQSFELFSKRCYGEDNRQFDQSDINVSELQDELEIIQARQHVEIDSWDVVWLGTKDKIFPFTNLSKAWQAYNSKQSDQNQVNIRLFDAPHAPFNQWSNWHEIIEG
jgi:biotin synthesis protein BioG